MGFSGDVDLYRVIPSGAGGVGRGFFVGLSLPHAIGSARLEGMVTGLRLPIVDPLAPSIDVELVSEASVVPGLFTVR
ncbi:MAG TPA: hypothetical protein VE288_06735 [Rubrobacteraceae bacterium]|nr:hypothetical protein [Rubrobacteraceae bacterium]